MTSSPLPLVVPALPSIVVVLVVLPMLSFPETESSVVLLLFSFPGAEETLPLLLFPFPPPGVVFTVPQIRVWMVGIVNVTISSKSNCPVLIKICDTI